jgi:hypothetical protein
MIQKKSANVSFKDIVVQCSSKVLRCFMVQWVYEFHFCWMLKDRLSTEVACALWLIPTFSFGSNQRLPRTCFVIFPHKAYIIREIQERPNQSNMSWLCWLLYYILLYRSAYRSSLTPSLLIKVPAPDQESGRNVFVFYWYQYCFFESFWIFLIFQLFLQCCIVFFIYHFFTDTINTTCGLLA